MANSSRITTASRMIVEQSFAVLHQYKFRFEYLKWVDGFANVIFVLPLSKISFGFGTFDSAFGLRLRDLGG